VVVRRTVVAVTALLVSAPFAVAQSFNQFNMFGDSTVESGYYKILRNPGSSSTTYNLDWAAAVATGAGAPTTNRGRTNSQILASYFGLTASPANQGGTDYATSGAKDVTVNDAQIDEVFPGRHRRRDIRQSGRPAEPHHLWRTGQVGINVAF
jgi:phospholipase/lecithinase/hemolysin